MSNGSLKFTREWTTRMRYRPSACFRPCVVCLWFDDPVWLPYSACRLSIDSFRRLRHQLNLTCFATDLKNCWRWLSCMWTQQLLYETITMVSTNDRITLLAQFIFSFSQNMTHSFQPISLYNIQYKLVTYLSLYIRYSRHPSNHTHFCHVQPNPLFFIRCPCFTLINHGSSSMHIIRHIPFLTALDPLSYLVSIWHSVYGISLKHILL